MIVRKENSYILSAQIHCVNPPCSEVCLYQRKYINDKVTGGGRGEGLSLVKPSAAVHD